jgi:hypothetical protein
MALAGLFFRVLRGGVGCRLPFGLRMSATQIFNMKAILTGL